MSKKIKKAALFFFLFIFIFTQFSVSYAASSSFTPYKAVITASSLNIRQTPSTSGKIVGYYKKGTIVDVVGISGRYLKTNKGYILSSYTKKYISASSTTASRGTSFTPYKAVVTLNYVNIRQGPSTNYKVIGKYYKNNIVNIMGIYGKFLKTDKGYIVNYSVKKVISNDTSTPNIPETPIVTTPPLYRAKVLASILSIRQEASSSSKEVGKYYRGDVVDVFAKEGSFLKTNRGYIYESYTERIQDTSRGNASNNVGKYLLVNEDTQLLLNTDGTHDERYAVKGKTYKIIDEENGYFKIKMGAVYGYIAADKVTVLDYQVKDKLTFAWNYIYAKSSNSTYWKDSSHYVNNNSASYGLDIISPTWLYMTGDYKNPSSIKVAEKADREYVIRAHRNGYEVHGLFSEFSADRAYAMFTNSNIRQQVIDDVVNYALTYNLDGINIDFEALGVKNKAYFTAFVKDLSERLHKANLTVSVDVTKITTDSNIWSGGYDRAALSKYVDYVMLMAYDEHYSGSKTPGSVGSYPWVDSAVRGLINSGVPADKLILGVPFYAREFTLSVDKAVQFVIFNTDQSGIYSQPVLNDDFKIENATLDGSYGYISLENGWYTVEYNGGQAYIPESDAALIKIGTDSQTVIGSRALKMQAVADNKVKYNGRVYFDDKARQNVLEYIDSDGNKRLTWIEDSTSMAWRTDIVNQYNLKGMAAWQTGFETRDIWDVIKQKLK